MMGEHWEKIKRMVRDNEINRVVEMYNEMEVNEAEADS